MVDVAGKSECVDISCDDLTFFYWVSRLSLFFIAFAFAFACRVAFAVAFAFTFAVAFSVSFIFADAIELW